MQASMAWVLGQCEASPDEVMSSDNFEVESFQDVFYSSNSDEAGNTVLCEAGGHGAAPLPGGSPRW